MGLLPCGIHSNSFQTLERRTLACGTQVYKSGSVRLSPAQSGSVRLWSGSGLCSALIWVCSGLRARGEEASGAALDRTSERPASEQRRRGGGSTRASKLTPTAVFRRFRTETKVASSFPVRVVSSCGAAWSRDFGYHGSLRFSFIHPEVQ